MKVDLNLSWTKHKEAEIRTSNSFELHRYTNLPKTITSSFKVSLEAGWKKKILPKKEQKGKQSSIDVIVVIDASGSNSLKQVKLNKKGRNWTGQIKLTRDEFHSNCHIKAYAIRNRDVVNPIGNFASEEFDIIGESATFNINFIKGTAPMGSAGDGRFVQFSTLTAPFNAFNELIAIDWNSSNLEVLINQGKDMPNGKKENSDIEAILRKIGIDNTDMATKKILTDSLLLQVKLVLISAILIDMRAFIAQNPNANSEEMINDLPDDNRWYIKQLLEYLYPDIQNNSDRPDQLMDDLKNDVKQLMGVRVIQAVQGLHGTTDNFRALSKQLI